MSRTFQMSESWICR